MSKKIMCINSFSSCNSGKFFRKPDGSGTVDDFDQTLDVSEQENQLEQMILISNA